MYRIKRRPLLLVCCLALATQAYAADPIPVVHSKHTTATLPEEIPIFPTVVWAEKTPLEKTLALQLGAASFYGDKFINSYALQIGAEYFFNAKWGMRLGASFLKSALTQEHNQLSAGGIRATVVEPTRIIYAAASYRLAYGKFLVGETIVRMHILADFGPALITNEIKASADRVFEKQKEMPLGIKGGLRLLLPWGERFSFGMESTLLYYRRPFSRFTFFEKVPTEEVRKDFSFGVTGSYRFKL